MKGHGSPFSSSTIATATAATSTATSTAAAINMFAGLRSSCLLWEPSATSCAVKSRITSARPSVPWQGPFRRVVLASKLSLAAVAQLAIAQRLWPGVYRIASSVLRPAFGISMLATVAVLRASLATNGSMGAPLDQGMMTAVNVVTPALLVVYPCVAAPALLVVVIMII